jgi:hypothetical protein
MPSRSGEVGVQRRVLWVGRSELFIWYLLIATWMKRGSIRFDKAGQKTAFTSGLCPSWHNGSTSNQTYIEISTRGLSDSDANAVNPNFQPVPSSSVTEKKGALRFTRNYSHQNEVSDTHSSRKNLTNVPCTDGSDHQAH